MATISQMLTAVEGLFASTAWTSNNIKAFPANYQGEIDSDEWIRVSVLPFSSTGDSFLTEYTVMDET